MPSDWTVLQLRASAHWIWCVKFLQMWALLTFPYTHRYPWASVLQMAGILLKSWNISLLKMYRPCRKRTIHSSARAGRTNSSRSNFFGVRPTNATPVRPVLPNISSLACQAPPKARALCQKWQGSTLALKLVVWTPKATACCSDRWSWPECSTFQHWQPFRKHFTGSSFVTGCVTQIYVLRELTGCSAGTAHPQVWEP